MSEPITPAELAEIRARADAATPGPWEVNRGHVGIAHGTDVEGTELTVLRHRADWQMAETDSDFIAHARTDVPRLVAEVERLNSLLERYRSTSTS